MRSRRAFFLFTFALLSGCAGSAAQFTGLTAPSSGKAVIYIYRVDLYVGDIRVAPNVRVNQESIGPLMRLGYFRVEAEPGPARVALYRVDKHDDTSWRAAQDAFVNLNLAPDKEYFVEFTLDRRIFSFKETSRGTALRSLPDLSPLN